MNADALTVHDLIELLKKMPQDAQVVVGETFNSASFVPATEVGVETRGRWPGAVSIE